MAPGTERPAGHLKKTLIESVCEPSCVSFLHVLASSSRTMQEADISSNQGTYTHVINCTQRYSQPTKKQGRELRHRKKKSIMMMKLIIIACLIPEFSLLATCTLSQIPLQDVMFLCNTQGLMHRERAWCIFDGGLSLFSLSCFTWINDQLLLFHLHYGLEITYSSLSSILIPVSWRSFFPSCHPDGMMMHFI